MMLSYVMGPGHCVVDGPFVDTVKVSACVERAEVGPEVALLVSVLWVLSEGEYADVSGAHQVDADGLEAVVLKSMVSACHASADNVWSDDLPT